jgi:hypothetical protein
MNRELGETRDELRDVRKVLDGHQISLAELKVDMDWLKRFFWILATGVLATLVASVMNLIVS